MTLYVIAGLFIAFLAFLIWFGTRERKAGGNAVTVEAQKEVIDGQEKVQAAGVATADPSTGRADRLRDRFTRK